MRHQQNSCKHPFKANIILKRKSNSSKHQPIRALGKILNKSNHQYGILVTEILKHLSQFYKTAPLKNTMEVGCVWRTTGGCFGSSYHVLIIISQIEEHHLVPFALYYHWFTSLWQPSFAFAIKSRKKAPLGCSRLQRSKSRQLPTFLVGTSTLKLIDSTENIT